MSQPYVLTDWTLHDYGDFRYLRGRPLGHPHKPSSCTIMTTHVERLEDGVATTDEVVWLLGNETK